MTDLRTTTHAKLWACMRHSVRDFVHRYCVDGRLARVLPGSGITVVQITTDVVLTTYRVRA